MRSTIHQMADKLSWYLYRRTCLSVFRSACLQADKLFPHVLPEVHEYVSCQQSEGGLGGYFTAMKLMELTLYLNQRKPTTVIEFGGGATTAVFSEYAYKTPGVRFISVDESEYFQNLTRDRLRPELRDVVTFVRADRIERDWRGSRVCHYNHSNFPDLSSGALMCYVDGPDTKPINVVGNPKKLPCVDVVMLAEAGIEISDILFDCRFASVDFALRASEFNAYVPRLHFRAAKTPNEWALVDSSCYHSILSKFDAKYQMPASPLANPLACNSLSFRK